MAKRPGHATHPIRRAKAAAHLLWAGLHLEEVGPHRAAGLREAKSAQLCTQRGI
jgi:hypothetical protein